MYGNNICYLVNLSVNSVFVMPYYCFLLGLPPFPCCVCLHLYLKPLWEILFTYHNTSYQTLIYLFSISAKPKVQVYSHFPGEYGKDNTLICHVSGFHPPDISIELLKDGVPVPDTKQTDLAFEKGWQFHLTKSAPFKPEKGETYTCKVRHTTEVNSYIWGKCCVWVFQDSLSHVFNLIVSWCFMYWVTFVFPTETNM